MGLGSLVRNQAVAIVVVLMLGFVIEPTLLALAPDVGHLRAVQRPADRGAGHPVPTTSASSDADLLSPGLAVLGMLAWIGLLFAGGAALLQRRDLD